MYKTQEPGFYFTRSERRGIFLLLGIIILLLIMKSIVGIIPIANQFIIHYEEHPVVSEPIHTQSEIQVSLRHFDPNTADKSVLEASGLSPSVVKSIINYRNKGGRFKSVSDLQKIYTMDEEQYDRIKSFVKIENQRNDYTPSPNSEKMGYIGPVFDPNTADSIVFASTGLKSYIIKNILNYRKKGGKFQSSEDLLKIYGMTNSEFQKISPHLSIDLKEVTEEAGNEFTLNKTKPAYQPIQLDINAASQPEWEYLRGIGPGYAKRIIAFREKLGGFTHIDQISETWGLPDSIFQQIKPELIFKTGHKKININRAAQDELASHPYISFKQAQLLVRFREQNGNYTGVNDIKKIRILETEWIEKILPYLDFSTGSN